MLGLIDVQYDRRLRLDKSKLDSYTKCSYRFNNFMSNNLNDVYNFIIAAEKSRKYLPSTATNLKLALDKIKEELNDEEKNSVDKILTNINQIFHNYYQKRQAEVSIGSVETYKSRIRKVINEYLHYGTDPTKMASWTPPITNKSIKKEKKIQALDNNAYGLSNQQTISPTQSSIKIELELRPNVKAIIITPSDITKDEVSIIQNYVNFLASTVKNTTIDYKNEQT